MGEPYGYFLTWTTYGTWLPGDSRGWVAAGEYVIHPGNAQKENQSRGLLHDDPITLSPAERSIVEQAIRAHCAFRNWTLHAVNARTNHVHVVVTADLRPEPVMGQLKAWSSRRLNEHRRRPRWWTEHGSTRWLNDESSFWQAVEYVANCQ